MFGTFGLIDSDRLKCQKAEKEYLMVNNKCLLCELSELMRRWLGACTQPQQRRKEDDC